MTERKNAMTTESTGRSTPEPDQKNAALAESIQENIATVAEFYAQEEEKISSTQMVIEKISCFFGSPLYFGSVLVFVALWIVANLITVQTGNIPFDEPPFILLQGIVGLNGLLITIAVLIRQNRMAKLEEKHAHLNLQVNLLTEQKTSKVIQLLEELRKDSPDVKDRRDPKSAAMQMQANPHVVLDALEEQRIQRHEN